MQRLEQIFEMIVENPGAGPARGLKGIREEGERTMRTAAAHVLSWRACVVVVQINRRARPRAASGFSGRRSGASPVSALWLHRRCSLDGRTGIRVRFDLRHPRSERCSTWSRRMVCSRRAHLRTSLELVAWPWHPSLAGPDLASSRPCRAVGWSRRLCNGTPKPAEAADGNYPVFPCVLPPSRKGG